MRLRAKLVVLGLFPLASAIAAPQSTSLDVQNMTCSLCGVTVKKALTKVRGVKDAKIDYDTKVATVTYDTDKATLEDLVKATANAGFPSTPRK